MGMHILIPYHPYGNGDSLSLELNGIEGVIIHLSVPENYGFDTIISEYFYRSPFMGARCAHKRLFLTAICSSDSWGLLTRIRSLSLLHALLRLDFLRGNMLKSLKCFEVV